jgi:Zn-finger nucleic acid-binding protein
MADNKELLTCPACGNEMKKIYLEGKSINIDICLDGCGGILFDNRELEKCDEAHENVTEILEAISNKTFIKVDESAQKECPVCGAIMMKMGAGSGNVQLDCCAHCGAKYLDNGELQRMRNGQKDIVPSELITAMDLAIDNHIENITYGLRPKKSSPRRQFVEDLIRKFF